MHPPPYSEVSSTHLNAFLTSCSHCAMMSDWKKVPDPSGYHAAGINEIKTQGSLFLRPEAHKACPSGRHHHGGPGFAGEEFKSKARPRIRRCGLRARGLDVASRIQELGISLVGHRRAIAMRCREDQSVVVRARRYGSCAQSSPLPSPPSRPTTRAQRWMYVRSRVGMTQEASASEVICRCGG